MKPFMDKDFLLSTDMAKTLYHEFAATTPILDYHCHISPQEIAEDRKFDNITQVWLGRDHYKWRQMRSNGVEEKYVTGDASDREKFQKWAETMPKLIGNPLYHWSHLELKTYFGYEGYLNGDTAEEVWNLCNAKLQEDALSVRNIIRQSNVTLLCTTNDPIDTLEWHKKIAEDETFDVQVLAAFRPDQATNINKPEWPEYISKLAAVSGVAIDSFESLKAAIMNRMDYFAANGCSISDHGIDYVMYAPASEEKVEAIFKKALAGESTTLEEQNIYKYAFLQFLGRQYYHRNWVMNLHYGCKRDNNAYMYQLLGKDSGFDAINDYTPSSQLSDFLNALSATNEVPKTILYSLNPMDNAAIDSLIGCFQGTETAGKIQHGVPWWFNDHKTGMTEHLISLANLGCLGNFIGMLTDSRSFLSYTRHEYFRRILCDLIGGWVENGEYPADMKTLEDLIKGISYYNAVKYFEFDL